MNQMRWRIAVLFMACGAAQAYGDWEPAYDDYPFYDAIQRGSEGCHIYATDNRDLSKMKDVCDLFPPWTFGVRDNWLPGRGYAQKVIGFIILVDRASVELVVPEDKATEMVANRMLTYVVAKAVAEAWGAHGGYHDVQVVFSYVPAFKEPVAFAVGLTTPTGFRVHMSEN